MGVRAGKYKLGARAGKHKFGARPCKYKLGARAGKYTLGARAGGQSQGRRPSKVPGAGKYKYPIYVSELRVYRTFHEFVVLQLGCLHTGT